MCRISFHQEQPYLCTGWPYVKLWTCSIEAQPVDFQGAARLFYLVWRRRRGFRQCQCYRSEIWFWVFVRNPAGIGWAIRVSALLTCLLLNIKGRLTRLEAPFIFIESSRKSWIVLYMGYRPTSTISGLESWMKIPDWRFASGNFTIMRLISPPGYAGAALIRAVEASTSHYVSNIPRKGIGRSLGSFYGS